MLPVLWLIPLLPLLGFAGLALAGGRLGRRALAVTGVVPSGLAAAVAVGMTGSFVVSPPAGRVFDQVLWTWFRVGFFAPRIALYLDPLSLVMMLVVACVGFLILVYSVRFMQGDEGYRRFFAYMNLFIASMLILVLADDFLFLLVGWEGVGLSSFLLIGFWYRERANAAAARKAFIVTRVGDTALIVGLLLIFTRLGTLSIQQSMSLAQGQWGRGAAVDAAAALLVLGGAVGKSAQLPLQTWLPDAMAGPTPVSALIHAATMVTAGVYLVARTHVLFELAPAARIALVVIGAVTLVYGGVCALAQTDIKRILAYSTISQVGYMFLGLGVAAWSAAIFHFMTHAFFKALLFLAAGLVIKAVGEEHDVRLMGGLRRELPAVFWMFLMGAASLSALPVVTAGFYSKELIVSLALSSGRGGELLWLAGVVGALLTSLYAFRLDFLVFFGSRRGATAVVDSGSPPSFLVPVSARVGPAMIMPMAVLAVGAIASGWIQLPWRWARLSLFTDFLEPVLPLPATRPAGFAGSVAPDLILAGASLAGVCLAYVLFGRRLASVLESKVPAHEGEPSLRRTGLGGATVRMSVAVWLGARPGFRRVSGWALAGLGFDRFYNAAFVRPFLRLACGGRDDVIERAFSGWAWLAGTASSLLARTQSGRLRYYLATAVFGVVAFVALGLLR